MESSQQQLLDFPELQRRKSKADCEIIERERERKREREREAGMSNEVRRGGVREGRREEGKV